MKRSQKSIDADVIKFRERMEFLETAWGVKTEDEVDLSTGKSWFKLTMPGSSTALIVHDVRAWNVLLPCP